MKSKNLIFLFFLTIVTFQLQALEIKGTIRLQDDWQPVVYLASLNSPENLFVASPEFVIAETFIQPDGQFLIQTSGVPEDLRFYRLYLVKGDNSAVEFNTSTHRNYMHLLLDAKSEIEIDAKINNNTLTVNRITGSEDNIAILDFDREIAARKEQFKTDITTAKRDFLLQDIDRYIRSFIANAPNSLVGLYALYHIDEKDTDFLKNSEFYFDFEKQLEAQYPNSFYSEKYGELLDTLVGFREMVCEMPGVQPKWKDQLLIAEAILIVLLLVLVVLLLNKNRKVHLKHETTTQESLYAGLTTKQQEILKLLANGKTNKEIATELFVELSTVKTHINNIYRQLNVSTRKEASRYYNSIQSETKGV
ncbi:helix-turn-helix transcriptional regulator [uncultured Draconibacterium sp.]|uniref:helix-turn-helix domain-containing protein n=1 Tax=uncultured Draconibacterium sp. TaxID=1573823 RepID=UPI0032174053